jgi:molybdenum cofactor cytidylyltransferase
VSFPQKSVLHRTEVVPIVLAAGASTRMGQRKECLMFGEVTCLDLVIDACGRAGVGEPIVVTREERKVALDEHLARRQRKAIVAINPRPELGQTSSLREGLKVLPAGARAFLIYPVDYPLVRPRDIERLWDAYVKDAPAVIVVAPSFGRRRGHPVLVDASVAPALLALPEGGSPRGLLGGLETRYVEVDDDRVLQDMDTPEDYEHCLARWAFGG